MAAEDFAIVTDSACDVCPEELNRWGVRCVNLQVSDQAGNPLASDNSPANVEAFYDWLAKHDELPKTSMPTPLDFGQLYSELARQGYKRIISLHLPEVMSGTCNCARMAAQCCAATGIPASRLFCVRRRRSLPSSGSARLTGNIRQLCGRIMPWILMI